MWYADYLLSGEALGLRKALDDLGREARELHWPSADGGAESASQTPTRWEQLKLWLRDACRVAQETLASLLDPRQSQPANSREGTRTTPGSSASMLAVLDALETQSRRAAGIEASAGMLARRAEDFASAIRAAPVRLRGFRDAVIVKLKHGPAWDHHMFHYFAEGVSNLATTLSRETRAAHDAANTILERHGILASQVNSRAQLTLQRSIHFLTWLLLAIAVVSLILLALQVFD
jgi:hypothetical protein